MDRKLFGEPVSTLHLRLAKYVWCDDEGRLWSLSKDPECAPRLHPDWWIQYVPEQWAHGSRGSLFIRSLGTHERVPTLRYGQQAWLVEAEKARELSVAVRAIYNSEELERFWAGDGYAFERYPLRPRPPRNLIADRVMLVRRLT